MNELIPFGDEKIAWVLATGFALLANLTLATAPMGINGIKEVFKATDFITWRKKSKKRAEYVNPNQAATMFKAALIGR